MSHRVLFVDEWYLTGNLVLEGVEAVGGEDYLLASLGFLEYLFHAAHDVELESVVEFC